jgi:hypothetical protein
MIRIAAILFSIAFCSFRLPVTEKYLLYHVNKEVHWLHNGAREKAKRGLFLSARESLSLAPDSDVMLLRNDGSSLLLEKPGTYTFAKVKALFSAQRSSSVSSGFFAYVFEKFLHGEDTEEKQKVTAAVYRSQQPMIRPVDSSFVFNTPLQLSWKPAQKNLPYKISISVNHNNFDTVIRKVSTFTVPDSLIREKGKTALLIQWNCYPYDSKQAPPAPFHLIIPKSEDLPIIRQQVKYIREHYAGKKELLRIMENDLFQRWMEVYQFKTE